MWVGITKSNGLGPCLMLAVGIPQVLYCEVVSHVQSFYCFDVSCHHLLFPMLCPLNVQFHSRFILG